MRWSLGLIKWKRNLKVLLLRFNQRSNVIESPLGQEMWILSKLLLIARIQICDTGLLLSMLVCYYTVRRQLWDKVINLKGNWQGPYLTMGDFNAILGAHERFLSAWCHNNSFLPMVKNEWEKRAVYLASDKLAAIQQTTYTNGFSEDNFQAEYAAKKELEEKLKIQRIGHAEFVQAVTAAWFGLGYVQAVTEAGFGLGFS
ncbi:hypothetical protein TIFTF001_027509 [Ficus carica]|uniref:Uncharacterized protein n=1 Tax=Ficus carica TaxID=3494 RepID=A0AA88DNB9_FICCA|nr:hypothetical protein TIFTF001_027509 [Ficus carica]